MTDQKTNLPYKEWQDEEGRMVQNGARSAAPLYVYADADYEEGDGSCGLHETVKRANEPAIQYRRADLLSTPPREDADELLELLEGTPDCIEELADNHPNDTSAHHLREFAKSIRAAIAKARG